MGYRVKATVNYPEDEADTPDAVIADIGELMVWLTKLIMTEHDATSYVITIATGEPIR